MHLSPRATREEFREKKVNKWLKPRTCEERSDPSLRIQDGDMASQKTLSQRAWLGRPDVPGDYAATQFVWKEAGRVQEVGGLAPFVTSSGICVPCCLPHRMCPQRTSSSLGHRAPALEPLPSPWTNVPQATPRAQTASATWSSGGCGATSTFLPVGGALTRALWGARSGLSLVR